MVTSRDVAKRAGVSQATVSRVLSDSPKVSAETRSRVLAAIDAVGYEPNAAARTMKTRLADTFGVIPGELTNPFVSERIYALADAIYATGRNMILWTSDPRSEEAAVRALRQGVVDGVIVGATSPDGPLRARLAEGGPFVLLNHTAPALACDQVMTDNADGGRLVARYFHENARRHVAVILGHHHPNTSMIDRAAGFTSWFAEHGRPVPPDYIVEGPVSHETGEKAMRELLSRDPAPDAVFCTNDVVAFGAIDAARELEVDVPGDVWVVGFGGTDIASWGSYELTTVRQPRHRVSRAAVELLIARLADPHSAVQHLDFPGELVVRRTTAFTDAR